MQFDLTGALTFRAENNRKKEKAKKKNVLISEKSV
jgi:hypothetical protein